MAYIILTIPQGDNFARAYSQFKDEYEELATSLLSWDYVATIKASLDDADSAALLTLTTAEMTVNNTTLEVGVNFTPEQLAVLDIGTSYYYVFKARSPGGVVSTIEECLVCRSTSARQTF
jgi:hypothetical protein